MSQINVEFIFEGKPIIIYCRESDKMKEVIKQFCIKSNVRRNSIYCLYSGNKIDENIKIKELIKSKNINEKISILVYLIDKENLENSPSIVKPSQVICPKCGEIALMSFRNYKIFLNCKNNHEIDNIFLKDFENTQKIDESKIICQECKRINKSSSFNKEFFICLNCKKNLCPLCKSNHNSNHNIINYDQKNYICSEHHDNYSLYCKTCKKNLCVACEIEHLSCETITFGKIFPKQNDLNNKMNELKIAIKQFKDEIKKLIEIMKEVCENMELIYNINNYICKSFDFRKKNFEILNNISEIKINDILRDIKDIINAENIRNKFIYISNMYTMMNLKENKNNIINNNLRMNINILPNMVNNINNNLIMNSNTICNFQSNFNNNLRMNLNSASNKPNNFNNSIFNNIINNSKISNNENQNQNHNIHYVRKHYKIQLENVIMPTITQNSNLLDRHEINEINNIIQQVYAYKVTQKEGNDFLSDIICQKIKNKIHGDWLVFVSDYNKKIPLSFSTIRESDFLIIQLGKTKFQIVKLK